MSRLARNRPDDEDGWANPRLIAPEPVVRCRCSHARISHTRRTGQCWSTACGCRTFRPEESKQ